MSAATQFQKLLHRLRQGDEQAATELIANYESVVRIAVRARLRDPVYARLFDSMDICQSVMASFFPRAALGEFDLEEPQQLVGLLVKMAQHKLSNQVRRHRAQQRDLKRDISAHDDRAAELVGATPTPSRIAMGRELLQEVHGRLTLEERQIADLRQQGFLWDEIARQLGGSPEARRKQFQRAIQVIATDLNLDDDEGLSP